jgi:hypothetical protein
MSAAALLITLALVLALIIGAGAERVRQAHEHWIGYRSRAMRSFTLEFKEAGRTVLWLAALIAIIYLTIRHG